MRLGVDVGGTFTDAVLFDGGRVHTAKTPTTVNDQSRGVLSAIGQVLATAGVTAAEIETFTHGMTVGTNALLEERGATTALVTTAGFADAIEIGRQNRPDLYRLCTPKPTPLVPAGLRFEVDERVGPGGVVKPLQEAEIDRLVDVLARSGAEAVAVCLIFSYLDPAHERMIAKRIRAELPALHVSVSSEVLAQFREYERFSTTVIDAYLSPLLSRYIGRLGAAAADANLPTPSVMLSSGGTVSADMAGRSGAWSVLSGPAGGAVGAGLLSTISGAGSTLGFDMGGTSCDVCVIEDGRVRRTDNREIGGRILKLPMVDVHTVGAGGGSIAWADRGGAMRVGPRSAGASPGPACYGDGGTEPTVTDANLVLGILSSGSHFAGGIRLDPDAAEAAVGRLGRSLGLDLITTAAGILRVANQEMTRALQVITVERGIDPRRFSLLPFGGAGPMHAAAIAEEMGIDQIICPRACGVLSALGLCASTRRRDGARTVMLSGESFTRSAITDCVSELARNLDGDDPEALTGVTFEMRYVGQSFELDVEGNEHSRPDRLREGFAAEHERRYGYRDARGEVELVGIRVAVSFPAPELRLTAPEAEIRDSGTRPIWFAGRWNDAEILRGQPAPGATFRGPAVLELPEATLALPPGWSANVDVAGTIVARRSAGELDKDER